MAKILVSHTIIEDLLFGYSENLVMIVGDAVADRHGDVVFDIAGRDIPADAAAEDQRAGVE